MSMHRIPLSDLEEKGLRAHGLDVGTPSQLSDVFRLGIKWATSVPPRQELTDAEICDVAKLTKTAEPGRDGYILPVAFARAIVAAHEAKKGSK